MATPVRRVAAQLAKGFVEETTIGTYQRREKQTLPRELERKNTLSL
jgi:hypothetical protein